MSVTREIPRYRCHAEVHALKIKMIIPNPRGFELHFEDERYAPHEVDDLWWQNNRPVPGAYFVVTSDGDQLCMPAPQFDASFTLLAPEPQDGCPPEVCHDEDLLEQLFWEFDAERKSGEERLRFKGFLRAYAQRMYLKQIAKT